MRMSTTMTSCPAEPYPEARSRSTSRRHRRRLDRALGLTYHGLAITDETKLGRVLADHGTTAFIAIGDGKLLYEQYFNGFRRDSLFKAFSVTKSITSALIGLAIADGLIGSIDDR